VLALLSGLRARRWRSRVRAPTLAGRAFEVCAESSQGKVSPGGGAPPCLGQAGRSQLHNPWLSQASPFTPFGDSMGQPAELASATGLTANPLHEVWQPAALTGARRYPRSRRALPCTGLGTGGPATFSAKPLALRIFRAVVPAAQPLLLCRCRLSRVTQGPLRGSPGAWQGPAPVALHRGPRDVTVCGGFAVCLHGGALPPLSDPRPETLHGDAKQA
jgi:hypothetical protein